MRHDALEAEAILCLGCIAGLLPWVKVSGCIGCAALGTVIVVDCMERSCE